MNWELILLLTGIMLFAYWLNYIMGSPLAAKPDDVDPKAILFWIPYFLAVRRLKELSNYHLLEKQLKQDLSVTSAPWTRRKMIVDRRLNNFIEAREFFTWERSLLCPICLHWWLSVIVGIVLLSFDLLNARADFFLAGFTYLVNHLIIRKIS